MDMDYAFVLIIAVMLAARAGFKRDVPMSAFYAAGAGWALNMVWGSASRILEYVLTFMSMIESYDRPESILGLVNSGVYTLTGLVLIIAVLLAARGAPVEAPPEPQKE